MSFTARKSRNSDGPELILHLGAHRTGSTRLQSILDSNQEVLVQNGIVALTPPRPGKRNLPTIRDVIRVLPGRPKHLPRYILKRVRTRALFSRLVADGAIGYRPRRIIVSEENLFGSPFLPTGIGLYPSTFRRLILFRNLVAFIPCEIHLTIRAYDTFLVSLYAMLSVYSARQVPTFEKSGQGILRSTGVGPKLSAMWLAHSPALFSRLPGSSTIPWRDEYRIWWVSAAQRPSLRR